MITLSDLMLKIMLPVAGLAFGAIFPVAQFGLSGWIAWFVGVPCAITGCLVLGFAGMFLDRLLVRHMIRSSRRKLAPIPTTELTAQLPLTLTPNLVLLELAYRGEALSNHLETMLSLLEHPAVYRRRAAWVAFQPAFPEYATRMRRYRPERPVADCHDQVEIVRKQLQTLDPST